MISRAAVGFFAVLLAGATAFAQATETRTFNCMDTSGQLEVLMKKEKGRFPEGNTIWFSRTSVEVKVGGIEAKVLSKFCRLAHRRQLLCAAQLGGTRYDFYINHLLGDMGVGIDAVVWMENRSPRRAILTCKEA